MSRHARGTVAFADDPFEIHNLETIRGRYPAMYHYTAGAVRPRT